MAPDAIHSHALSHQCNLARATLHLSTVKTPAHSGYLPVTPEQPTDSPTMVSPTPTPTFPVFQNLQLYLWGALQSVLYRLWAAKELLSCTRVLLFLCSGYLAREAMKGNAEKIIVGRGGAEEVEEEDQTSAAGLLETLREEGREVLKRGTMKVEEEREVEAEDLEESSDEEEEEEEEEDDENDEEEQVEVDESELDWIEWGSEEEEDAEDEDTLGQQALPTGSREGISFSLNCKQASDEEKDTEGDDEEDSDWSDDDDDDSEASAESVELWESFLHSSDPYNPLSFSCTPVSRNSRNTPASAARGERRVEDLEEEEEREDRQHSSHSTEQNKKVRFSDEVTVRPLVAWAFASKAARNGSCWMEMARDRDRFRRRVEDAGKVISPCLSHDHRRLVWKRLQQQSAL